MTGGQELYSFRPVSRLPSLLVLRGPWIEPQGRHGSIPLPDMIPSCDDVGKSGSCRHEMIIGETVPGKVVGLAL